MAALVLELQKEALSKDIGLTDLLRKTYFVARKLKVKELEEWVNHELHGYPPDADLPSYRNISGSIKAHNPFHGWQPILIQDERLQDMLLHNKSYQAVSEIEHMLQNYKSGSHIVIEYPPGVVFQLHEILGRDLRIALHVQPAALYRILDSIKNLILNWALKLEEDGILGDEISFSAAEIQKAAQANYNITNIHGDVIGSQLQQGTSSSKQKAKR